MAAQAQASGVVDGLRNILGELSKLSTMPDAHPEFFPKIIQAIQGHLKELQNPQAAHMGAGGPGGMQPPPGMPPRPNPGMGGGFGGASVTGGMSAPAGGPGAGGGAMPNPDELRRMLAGSGNAG